MEMILPRMVVVVLVLACFPVQSQIEQDKPWERLGLSQTEWKEILDNNIPMNKVEELLKSGVGIGEYLEKPWVKLKMTEDRYLYKRRSGMTASDIELEANTEKDSWKKTVSSGLKSDIGGMGENGAVVLSLVPGLQQMKAKRYWTSGVMAGAVVGSVAWCVTGTILAEKHQFEYIPIVFILIPDIGWSVLDYRFHIKGQVD